MISQQRLDELKRCSNPHQFFDEFSCEVNSIVKSHRKAFENKAHSFGEKHKIFQTALEKWLKKQKKPLLSSVFEQYQKQLSGANNSASSERLSILEQCQKQLSDILKNGVNVSNHPALSRETTILKQCQNQLNDVLRQLMSTGKSFSFALAPELDIIERCLSDIRRQYQRAGWKEIKILHSEQTRKGEYRTFPLKIFVPPDFPDDPDWWLEAYSLLWYDPKAPVARNEFTCSTDDELLRGYIALALLFNEQAKKRGETLIASDILSEFWIPQNTVKFLQAYWTETENKNRQKPTDYWPDVRNVLISDLEAVDKDLASTKQTEAKQKNERSTSMTTTISSKENWEAIEKEYGLSKKDFGKKINFVKDPFKRKIIFRDVEHAFVLASQDFSKPAIILAGGVIEELLRLYLDHKKIKVTSDRFVDYINACEKLLKRGVWRLTDSVRDFRNLVHLANEKEKKHTISKATAKGAVSSIFTIANDFQ